MHLKLIPIEYNDISYPSHINCDIKEVAGHFDKSFLEAQGKYSLHTEYSYGKRKFNSPILSDYKTIIASQKKGIPQLWKSEKWALEFANFIIQLTNGIAPHIIEIHPPFSDYCDINTFIERYLIFEKAVKSVYPKCTIVIENRAGSRYSGGKFILSKANDISELIELLKIKNINLGVVIDFPQLLTAENLDTANMNFDKFSQCLEILKPHTDYIKGIHMWGKKKSPTGRWVSHCGTLDTFFLGNSPNKLCFINLITDLFDDDTPRFFVPEVNSSHEDLLSIVNDFFD